MTAARLDTSRDDRIYHCHSQSLLIFFPSDIRTSFFSHSIDDNMYNVATITSYLQSCPQDATLEVLLKKKEVSPSLPMDDEY
jgi:hypothetical protein